MIVVCELCGDRFPASFLIEHFSVRHGEDLEIEEWPDGEPVVVDLTLQPADFVTEGD